MSTDPAHPVRRPRLLALVCVGLAASAGLLWGASAAPWFVVTPDGGRGPVTFTGAEVLPALTGWALLALAGIAGAVAAGGLLRRAVGGLLAVVGAWSAIVGVEWLFRAPFAAGAPVDGLPQAPPSAPVDVAGLVGMPVTASPAPLLAVAGAVVLLAVGLAIAVAEPTLPRLGAAYAAPGARRPPADPDRDAWNALDEGYDPTAGPLPDGSAR